MSVTYRLKINTRQPLFAETLKRFSIHIVVMLLMVSGFSCSKDTDPLVGIAGASSAPTTSVCKQPSVLLGSGSANKIINIQSSDGVEALTFLIPRSYSTMLFSSSKLKSGTTYTVYSGGSVTGGTTVNGIYTAGEYTPGTKSTSFIVSSMFTKVSGSMGPG